MTGESKSDIDQIVGAYRRRRERHDAAQVVDFIHRERQSIFRTAVTQRVARPIGELTICDVGCGAGADLESWRATGADESLLAGTELLAEPLAVARARLPKADLRLVSDFGVPWPDGSFDVVWSSMALSSILSPSHRKALFSEMVRTAKPGGVIGVYDLVVRKPTNPNVVALNGSRIRALGPAPEQRISATPFLPLLNSVLSLPTTFQRLALALLPRTHAVWIWTKPSA